MTKSFLNNIRNIQATKNVLVYFSVFFVQLNLANAQIKVIDAKGSQRTVDTSKWSFGTPNVNNIFNKNIGNVGIGTNLPTFKLDVAGKLRTTDSAIVNALRIIDVSSGANTDSLLMWQENTGNVRKFRVGALPLSGDVTGSLEATTVARLQGRNLSNVAPTAGQILKWNAFTTQWEPSIEAASSNWLLTGNNNATATNFLGTINDFKMTISSNNTPMLEFGRRATLGLTGSGESNIFPYNQANNSVVHVRGSGGVSALQMEASSASIYKPLFFTDANGNFKMRGSSAGTDYFELGSAGASNSGSLEFVIGDDGNEPIIFRRASVSGGATSVELMRLQGVSGVSSVRTGINLSGTQANSTFQVVGSVSKSITTTNAATFTLTETHYTVIFSANTTITLPAANTCLGRIYILKKTINGQAAITTFIDENGNNDNDISQGITVLQSDGTNWQQINN